MREALLDLLRCPYCGTRLSVVDNDALARTEHDIVSGVLGCECCAFPIVEGIPVLIADDATRDAMHALEAGRHEEALFRLLGLGQDKRRAGAFRTLLARGEPMTYREALCILCRDAEGTYFLYRLSDPTFVVAEALLRALGQHPALAAGRALDLCGGSGHLTRLLAGLPGAGDNQPGAGGHPDPQTDPPVVADVAFWKLWLATKVTAPGCTAICCDANHPLPFVDGAFSLVVLADAFPYIWHKRLLAGEMTRLAAPDGAIVMPHLHSALGDNMSAGDTLTPAAYTSLFSRQQPRLFSDEALLTQVLDQRVIDLTQSAAAMEIGSNPAFTLVASRDDDLFRRYEVPERGHVSGALIVNPLYRVERRGGSSIVTLSFPTAEYAEEFAACRRYLPDTLTVDADLTRPLDPSALGSEGAELRRRRVLLDAPPHYL